MEISDNIYVEDLDTVDKNENFSSSYVASESSNENPEEHITKKYEISVVRENEEEDDDMISVDLSEISA